MVRSLYLFFLTLSLFFFHVTLCRPEISEKCDTCHDIVKKFKEGLIRTAKSNFGGGNTHWEEKNLGSYAFSETRLLEILEGVCSNDGKEEKKCHHMLEANEEFIENWWFRRYAKGIDVNLNEYMCVKKMAVCCPNGTFGVECKDCIGGREKPCKGNGRCEGDGTRDGSGICICDIGYMGDDCDECSDGFYEMTKNKMNIVCKACHMSCKSTCSEGGMIGCDECRDGWQQTDDNGCVDLDECEDVSMCGTNEFCTNTEGSYTCSACHSACAKCTASSAKDCLECSIRHFKKGSECFLCHESCANSCSDETSSTCNKCSDGWSMSQLGTCVDVDECEDDVIKRCRSDEYCVNRVGSFKCSTCHPSCLQCSGPGIDGCTECKSGYHRNKLNQCSDTDECADRDMCLSEHKTCLNTPGSFKCECEKGFVLKEDACILKMNDSPKSESTSKINSKISSVQKKQSNHPKKKSKQDSSRMTVSREDSLRYTGSLVVFTVICFLLKRSLLVQTLFTGTFWFYLYSLTSQVEQYVVKSTS